jgi:N-acetyltransferase 10
MQVLWMYKKDLLGFSSHKKKREAKLKKQQSKGMDESPFDMFVAATDIKYCYYKESERILGYFVMFAMV